jgi:hypothetical protein
MSKFMFSIFTNSNLNKQLLAYCDHEEELFEKFGIIYLSHWNEIYSLTGGINEDLLSNVDNLIL